MREKDGKREEIDTDLFKLLSLDQTQKTERGNKGRREEEGRRGEEGMNACPLRKRRTAPLQTRVRHRIT